MAPTQIVPITNHSDGDPSHRPKDTEWTIINPPTIYLEKLAVLWLKAQGKPIASGATYRLDKLPHGYALFEKQRKTGVAGTKLTDKRLFGSRIQKYFDSPNRFFPHFLHLMDGKDMRDCPCTVCNAVGGPSLPMRANLPARPASVKPGPGRKPGFKPKPSTKPPTQVVPAYQDDEHVPDTLRILIDRLKRQGQLETDFNEELSMDWRSERGSLPRLLNALPKHASFVPRVGELVLFVRFLDDESEICREDESGEYKIFDLNTQQFQNFPRWEAGVVAQNAPVQLEDILVPSNKTRNSALAGFRIEPLPKPGHSDKSASKQYKYVPLHWIRPFTFWQEFLRGIPESTWHPTIHNVRTAMASFSLMEKYAFSGTWPKAQINCKGVYVGAELWVTGDAVRILPDSGQEVTDVLHITSVVLELSNLDTSTSDDDDDKHPYNSTVWLYGKLYTTDRTRTWRNIPERLTKQEEHALPQGLKGYTLYHRHDPRKSARAPLKKVLGRCFEAESIQLWFPTSSGERSSVPSLSLGLAGHDQARNYARDHDKRVLPDKSLYWADNRGEALEIAELNGVLLSRHDPERDEDRLDDWTSATRMLSNTAGKFDKYKLNQKASQANRDSAVPTTEADEDAKDSPAPVRTDTPANGRQRLRPSATPSEELQDYSTQDRADVPSTLDKKSSEEAEDSQDDGGSEDEDDEEEAEEDEDEINARFGLSRDSRKRSRSVAGVDEADEASSVEDEDVKGVARSKTSSIAKVGGSLVNALGWAIAPESKKPRTASKDE